MTNIAINLVATSKIYCTIELLLSITNANYYPYPYGIGIHPAIATKSRKNNTTHR